jgi:hypothetical protein
MRLFFRILLACGVDRKDIELMVKRNPAWLLRLS